MEHLMLNEIGAGIGGILGIGTITLVFRFLNAKIEKKQDKTMCDERSGGVKENIERIEQKVDVNVKATHSIDKNVGQILQELKHLNGKT